MTILLFLYSSLGPGDGSAVQGCASGGYQHNDRPRPATWRHLLAADAALVAAVVALFGRPYLPSALKPEQRAFAAAAARVRTSALALRQAPDAPPRAPASETLIVGDSVIKSCPWPAERLGSPGMTSTALLSELCKFLQAEGGRHYARIVLWPGTWDMMQGMSVDQYVANAVAMLDVAQAHADTVVLLSPMPAGSRRSVTSQNRRNVLNNASALAKLRVVLPGNLMLDMGAFRANAENTHHMRELFLDNLHISQLGYHLLAAEYLSSKYAVLRHPAWRRAG